MNPKELSKGQKTALRILEAAARCVAKIGAEKTSITAIAQEAKLKRSLIAYHFPKKEDIFYQVMKHIMVQFGRSFLPSRPQPTANTKQEKQILLDLVSAYMDYFQTYPHYFHCYLHCFYLASVHEHYKKLNTRILKRIIIRLQIKIKALTESQGLIVPMHDIEDFANIIYSNLLGTIMSYYTVIQTRPYEEYKKHGINILFTEIDLFLERARTSQTTKTQR
ncbi:MAG: TetR/AcrR family transcriptional regulator [Bdellovibrio sp.]|nr:TetR/AcrR family transcriptional regulator [Bdellovibrio sp.]